MHMDRFSQSLILRLLEGFHNGSLEMTLPDGQHRRFGTPDHGQAEASIAIHNNRFFRRVLLHGEIGFGESFMDGDWDTPDLTALLAFFIDNLQYVPGFASSSKSSFFFNSLRLINRMGHFMRRNTKQNSRRNIRDHYDLSNDFYALWLDSTWTYSSAIFDRVDESLEEAQTNKYRRLAEKVNLSPGKTVLEIGCGWGGFSIFAAREYGVKVTGITISEEQYKLARQRVAEAGLEEQVDIQLLDYRDIQGQYDAIVSIEMLEAVGHEFLIAFFSKCHHLLKRDGVLGLQVIISPDCRYDQGRRSSDWIKKHVFPGGQLPSIAAINRAINRSGDLYLQHLESFGLHYARTLAHWRDVFNRRVQDVHKLGFDDRFIRKWNFYLSYCEAAFARRNINVSQMVFTRPNNASFQLPVEAKN